MSILLFLKLSIKNLRRWSERNMFDKHYPFLMWALYQNKIEYWSKTFSCFKGKVFLALTHHRRRKFIQIIQQTYPKWKVPEKTHGHGLSVKIFPLWKMTFSFFNLSVHGSSHVSICQVPFHRGFTYSAILFSEALNRVYSLSLSTPVEESNFSKSIIIFPNFSFAEGYISSSKSIVNIGIKGQFFLSGWSTIRKEPLYIWGLSNPERVNCHR